MTLLLDRFTPVQSAFRPQTATELFSLRLAQKLGDAVAVRHFASLVESYSEGQILCAYRRTVRDHPKPERARRFLKTLEHIQASGSPNGSIRMISIRIERRSVAAAILNGEQLEYTDVRQLSSDRDRALASAVGFIVWMLNRFSVDSAGLEELANGHEFQRRILHDAICEALRARYLPIWQIPKSELLEGCGQPPLRSRAELRTIATSVWPVLEGAHAKVFIQDAAILGLHLQIERLFIIN